MNRYIGIMASALLFTMSANAEIVLKVPETANSGDMLWLNFDKLDSSDIKVVILINGKPAPNTYRLLRDWNNQPIIGFQPKENGLYTIIVSGNKDSKTDQVIYNITVGPTPKPPAPGPVDPLLASFKAAYTNPDPASLDLLIRVITQVRAQTYGSNAELITTLKAASKQFLGDGDPPQSTDKLRPLRDAISTYLASQLKTFDQDKANQALDNVISKLSQLK